MAQITSAHDSTSDVNFKRISGNTLFPKAGFHSVPYLHAGIKFYLPSFSKREWHTPNYKNFNIN